MNIFLRELKSHWKGILFWSLGMVGLVGSGMAKFDAYQSTGQSINQIMSAFPKSVQIILGISGFDLTTASGFYGLLFLYTVLMATIHAVLLGSDMIAKEERDKTSEFLFSKPISRARAVTGKLLAGLAILAIFNFVAAVSSIYSVKYFNKGASATHDILLLMAGMAFLQLIFFSIGAVVAAINKRQKTSASIATAVLLLTFILSFLISLNDKLDALKYLSPFKYFEAQGIMAHGRLDPAYMALSGIIIAILLAGTYYFYSKRDLNV